MDDLGYPMKELSDEEKKKRALMEALKALEAGDTSGFQSADSLRGIPPPPSPPPAPTPQGGSSPWMSALSGMSQRDGFRGEGLRQQQDKKIEDLIASQRTGEPRAPAGVGSFGSLDEFGKAMTPNIAPYPKRLEMSPSAPNNMPEGEPPPYTPKKDDLESMIADMQREERQRRGMASAAQGFRNATDSFRTTGAAIRLGANPVPETKAPPGSGLEGNSMNSMIRYQQANRRMDQSDTQEARRQGQYKRATGMLQKGVYLAQAREQTRALVDKFNDGEVNSGPISGRVQTALRKMGFAGANTAVSLSMLMSSLSRYVYSQTGAQASKEEYDRLSQTLPMLTDNPEAFQAALQNFMDVLDRDLETMDRMGTAMDYDMSFIKNEVGRGSNPAPTEGSGGTVKMRSAKGAVRDVPAEDVEFLKEQGWTK